MQVQDSVIGQTEWNSNCKGFLYLPTLTEKKVHAVRDLKAITNKRNRHITPLLDPKDKCMTSEMNKMDHMIGRWEQDNLNENNQYSGA